MPASPSNALSGSVLTPAGWVMGKVVFEGARIVRVEGNSLALASTPKPPYIIPGGPGDTSFSRIGGDQGLAWTLPLGGGPARPYAMTPYGGTVDPFLWRGALETLSTMPLASADPFAGVIVTDWYTAPNAPGERFRSSPLPFRNATSGRHPQ